MNPWANLVAFQALWFAIVLGAARGYDWLGIGLLLAWLPVHLRLSTTRLQDLRLFLALGLLGPLLDSLLMRFDLIGFNGLAPHQAIAPWWIAALWANFALTLNHSLRWVRPHPLAAAALGALGGPLAYYAGARLGAADLSPPAWQPLVALALVWGAAVPVLGRFANSANERAQP